MHLFCQDPQHSVPFFENRVIPLEALIYSVFGLGQRSKAITPGAEYENIMDEITWNDGRKIVLLYDGM